MAIVGDEDVFRGEIEVARNSAKAVITCFHPIQVHHTLGELYGRIIMTNTRTLMSKVKRAKGFEGCEQSQKIIVKFRRRKMRHTERVEVFTKFTLRKENKV